ncbi:MAG TPA: ATP-binding cassette domain-containing protein [Anaerovoracaceae bacterium]|nr:ATP-binding cassette domain-containing protein [Anaerovoracaceae bacterium]
MNEILSVDQLAISFGSNEVLKSINFKLHENEVLGVIGPNGAGKTVMLNILTGILKPSKGTVTFLGEDITKMPVAARCREGVGRTFQVPRPFEKMTVFENILVGCVYGGRLSEKHAKNNAMDILEKTKLADRRNDFAGKLGLLDRKRLEVGRALATNPKVLLLDEVGGGLTESEVEDVLDLVRMVKSQGVSVVWIEHIIKTMLEGTDKVLLLANGRDIVCGSPINVMNSPEVKEIYIGCDNDQ